MRSVIGFRTHTAGEEFRTVADAWPGRELPSPEAGLTPLPTVGESGRHRCSDGQRSPPGWAVRVSTVASFWCLVMGRC